MSVTPNRREEYEQLCRTIQNWNENRLELFEISQPKETLEFEGVMRFYFQSADGDGQKVATKCIRVSSTTTTVQVVEALVQKFRPDLRMLTTPSLYTLYEVHADGEERMLDKDEHPLWVQLNWVEGNREGRFLLKKMTSSNGLKLSSKKDKKNKEDKKKAKNKQKAAETPENDSNEEQGSIARSLYTDMPESRLTRSVSLKQGNMRVVHREPGSGADSGFQVHVPADLLLSPDTPCKPLPIGDRDTAAQIVRSAVEKYEIPDDPAKFCLVQVSMPNVPTTPDGGVPANVQVVEKVLEDTDLPLLLYSKWAMTNGGAGALQFQLRRRASFNQGKALGESPVAGTPVIADLSMYPILVEVIQGSVGPQSNPRTYPLVTTPAELGSDPKCCVRLTSGGIRPRHCTIASSSDRGTYTVAPLDKAAAIQVNNKPVRACTALPNSAILKLGDTDTFQFLVPLSTSNKPRPVPPLNAQESCRNSRQGQPGAPNLSKAFSSEDILNPSSSSSLKRPLKERAFSEYHLPGDGTPKGQGSTPESDTPAVESKGASIASVDALEWAILPASLFFYHAKGSLLLQTLILEVEGYTLQFKLGPAFALYMMARCYLSPDFQPGVSTSESKKNLVLTLKNVATNIKRAIKDNRNIAGPLAFWLANTSELLHFLKRDRQLSLLSHEYSNLLTQQIRTSYKNFTEYMLKELNVTISAFLDETSDADTEDAYLLVGSEGDSKEPDVVPTTAHSQLFVQTAIYWSVSESRMRRRGRPTMGDVLFTLNSTLALLQSCRVNATLCVLTVSSLFHYISTRLFNKLMSDPEKYCSPNVGMRLGKRLERIVAWAETQGMELPAQEHLTLILQAASLLRIPKDSSQDAQKIFSTCPHLNSRQMNTLLVHCQAKEGEAVVSTAVVDKLVALATLHTDKQLQTEGLSLNLEEDINLELPFHVPEDGYYCDGLVGVPSGLQEYLESAVNAGLCKLNINGEASGSSWIFPARKSDSCHSLEMIGENERSATLPRSLGTSQKSQDALDSTITIRGFSTLPRQPPHDSRIVQFTITKEDTNNSLGISIIGGKGYTHGDVGIFIRSLTPGGAAQVDGRLSKGDQILMVDGKSLEEATQQQAASILRSTGKTITLTVSKHAAHYLGLQALIGHDSPRNTRQDMNIPEGTSHAQKAKRRERRERERAQQQYGGDPRLDSRRGEDIPERSTASLPPQHQHLAKWLSGQRGLVRGHDDDHRSSTSTLSNVPEQERPASSGPSSLRSGTGEGRHSISTPPIRDSGLTRPRDSDSSTFSSLVQLETASMEASTRYSDYSQELEYHRQPLPAGSAVGQSHPHHGNPLTYGDTFNLSSQSALQSQSFPPVTMSQQRVTAQDRLSMDVLQHTQPSSASLSGVGAVLAKVKASSAIIGGKDDAHFLLSSDLKDLEMDDVELEKQRIHLLLYEEQKEKELTTGKMKELFLEQEIKVSEEELRLRKELLSIEDMIVQQKKRFKDLKYNREREERRLKETEKQLQDIIVQTALLTGDQQRQLEQKQRQSELEQRKRDHDKRVQYLLGNEHASKIKVLALDSNAKEIREQLQKYEKCPQKEEVASKTILMVAPRQDDEFSSDIPRPGSPSVMREGMQMKLPEQLDAAAERRINPSWSAVPGLSTTRDTSSRGTAHVSKAMSVSDLSEPSEDGDSRPAKLSVAYDNASRPNPPRTSEQYSYRSHSRDEIDDISRGYARDSYERPRIEGVLAPSAVEHAFNPPISPQQLRGDGRYYRGHETVGAGRSNSSSAWYQSSIQPPHSFQRPSSANSRSDSPSAYNRPDRPDQGPPSAYSRPDQGPSNTYNQPDQGLSNTYRLDQGPPITYNRFDQGPPNPYNRPVAGRSDQQAPGGFQNRMEQSPALNLPGRSEQGISGTGSRPGSAFSDHRSDLEPARMGTVSTSSRPDTNGRLGHHYSRQTKSRVTQRSLNQSSSTDNLIATTETVGIGSARQVGTPDVVPSVRGERPTGVAGRAPESSTQTLPSVRASRENHVALSSGDISSPRLPHGKHESDIPPVAPGGERMRLMTFSGISNLAPRPSRGYEQVLPQQGRAIPQGYLHDQKSYGQVTSPQPKPYELVAPTLQSNPHEPGRSYSAAQGRPYEQGQQGRSYELQGQPSDQLPQARSYDQSALQGRLLEQPLPQGRSYDQAPWPQGRPYEQVMQAQRKSHDNVSSHQGRPYDQAPVAQQGTQGRPYEQVALAQGRAHDTEPTAQGRSYDPVTTQRRSYEQFVLPPQGKPQEQSWVAQPPLPGRPYESSTLQAGQLQGQRPAPYERTFLGGDILNVGRNPVGYPSKTGSHSYSRRRPDPPQQVMMTLEDKMKHYIEGMEEPSYPDRIQRQQTEL